MDRISDMRLKKLASGDWKWVRGSREVDDLAKELIVSRELLERVNLVLGHFRSVSAVINDISVWQSDYAALKEVNK